MAVTIGHYKFVSSCCCRTKFWKDNLALIFEAGRSSLGREEGGGIPIEFITGYCRVVEVLLMCR